MPDLKELFQDADWKKEKHVPVIELPAQVKKGEPFAVRVSVGKEIAHPNKTEHHISWIDVYFQPEGSTHPLHVGRAEFNAHGASTDGPDTSTVYASPEAVLSFRTDKPGTVYAASFCNIHGLWEGRADLRLA